MIEHLATILGYWLVASALSLVLYATAIRFIRRHPRRLLRRRIQTIICQSHKGNVHRRARHYCCEEIPCLYADEGMRLFDDGINTHH